MFYYAELNEDNVCFSIVYSSKKSQSDSHIEINQMDENYLFRKYNDGEWSEEKYVPDHAQIELNRMEDLEQSQSDQDDLIMSILLGED